MSLVLLFSAGSVIWYFIVRGTIEGAMFSGKPVSAGMYHFYRLLESWTVLIAVAGFALGGGSPDAAEFAVGSFALGLGIYEIVLGVSQYGKFPPPETIIYEIFDFSIEVTPAMKAVWAYGMVFVGLVIIVWG